MRRGDSDERSVRDRPRVDEVASGRHAAGPRRGRPDGPRRRHHRGARRLRLRQDDAAAAGRRLPRRSTPARSALGGRTVAGAGAHVPPQRRGVGYVAQEGALFPHLDVARQHRSSACRARERSDARLREMLDLAELPRTPGRRLPARALRRPAAAGRPRPRARAPAPRWCCSTSPSPPSTPALRASAGRGGGAACCGTAGRHGRPGHPRPGRGALAGRPGRGDARRPGGAGRSSPVDLYRAPGRHRGRAASSAAPTCCPATPRPPPSARRPSWSTPLWGCCRSRSRPVTGDVQVVVRPEQVRLEPLGDVDAADCRPAARPRSTRSSTTATTPRCGCAWPTAPASSPGSSGQDVPLRGRPGAGQCRGGGRAYPGGTRSSA